MIRKVARFERVSICRLERVPMWRTRGMDIARSRTCDGADGVSADYDLPRGMIANRGLLHRGYGADGSRLRERVRDRLKRTAGAEVAQAPGPNAGRPFVASGCC